MSELKNRVIAAVNAHLNENNAKFNIELIDDEWIAKAVVSAVKHRLHVMKNNKNVREENKSLKAQLAKLQAASKK